MKKPLLLSAMLLLVGAGCAAPDTAPSPSPSVIVPDVPAPLVSERVDLSDRGLTALPAETLKRTDAVELDISRNRIGGALPAEIRFLSRLKSLNASDNVMTGVPAEVGQLSDLEILNLSNNRLTGLPHEIGNLSNLKILNLTGNAVSSYDLEILRDRLPNTNILVDAEL